MMPTSADIKPIPQMRHVLSHAAVLESFAPDSWQRQAAEDGIEHIMANNGRDFPCVFAIRAVANAGFHYVFADDCDGSNMAEGLREFLGRAHDIGAYATLSYVFPPDAPPLTLEEYHARFWSALFRLHALDTQRWPSDIPTNLTDPDWTFCFEGEAIFPLCLTPAHIKKRTRYASCFTISFQPRWTFKEHLPNAEIMNKYSDLIQQRLHPYDSSPISPQLGLYGAGFLDAYKYFFHDDNILMPHPESLDGPQLNWVSV